MDLYVNQLINNCQYLHRAIKCIFLLEINYPLPIINYQLSITHYQLSIINYPLSITHYQLSITNY
ncbi:MAG TPA: hypothetical protein V6C58_18685, partial [Allocoleopsis sp.]